MITYDLDHLYHYTNVSSLAMILKNQSIKFNPLTVLDDIEEEKVLDNQKYGKYCFISSWTSEEIESIPMWNMYTNLSEGVRIKLPLNPFKEYTSDTNFAPFNKINKSFIPPHSLVNNNYYISTNNFDNLLHEVEYTDCKEMLYPKIKVTDVDPMYNFNKLGMYKNKYWEFQKEWRYIVYCLPFGIKDVIGNTENINILLQEKFELLDKGFDLPFNYYFFKLDKRKFRQMEITLSPKISEGNIDIVNLLKEKYNPEAKINYSVLHGKIR